VGGHSDQKIDFDLPGKFTKVVLEFADESKLFFNDMRVFGYMKIVDEKEKERIEREFGVEPVGEFESYKVVKFIKLLEGRKTAIKTLLMNQKIIAGIGNIYADEICFCSKIKPARKVDSLKPLEIKQLFKCIPQVLKLAIANRGTTFNNYVDSAGNKGSHLNFLKVYGREGEKCRRCHQGVIKKTKMVGRGTHFCEECQI